MNIDWGKFVENIVKHFDRERGLITEDLIRYWFIKQIKNACKIEVPYFRTDKNGMSITPLKILRGKENYLKSNRNRLDLYFEESKVAIEFKYHRKTDYSNNCTATNIGEIFNDINRISILDCNEKYIVYVFDDKMKKYYQNNGGSEDKPQYYFNIDKVHEKDNFVFNSTKSVCNYNGMEFLKNAFSSFKIAQYDEITKLNGFSNFTYILNAQVVGEINNEFCLVVYKVDEIKQNT